MAERSLATETETDAGRVVADAATLDAIALARQAASGDAAATSRLLKGLASRVVRVVLGWSLEEIAGQSGAPLNTVRSRLRLAKESLRKTIETEPGLLELLEVER